MFVRDSYLIKIFKNRNIYLKFNIDPIGNAMLISHECVGEKLKAYKTWNLFIDTIIFRKVKDYD